MSTCTYNGSNADFEADIKRTQALFLQTLRPTISSAQRNLRIGYLRAVAIMDVLEQRGVVSKPDEHGQRTMQGEPK
jgi:DNA segregation ATPase FtsK/SpoIIIE-like protein